MKANILAIGFDSDSCYIIMCFLRCVAIKIVVFYGYKNIHLICVIPAAVTYKDICNQSDRLNSLLVLGEAGVILGETSSS